MKMNPKATYCHFDEDQVRESGLLGPQRMSEVTATITAKIEPCFDHHGVQLKHAFIAECLDGRKMFPRCEDASSIAYMRRCVLAVVLTDAELELVNDRCLSEGETRKNIERFAKAMKVEAWDGGAWLGDRYFSSMDELCDHLESEGGDWPEYVWSASSRCVISKLDVAEVCESSIDNNGWEDMDTDDLHGITELQAALDKFTEANAAVLSYWPDYSTAILLAPWKQP